MKLKSTLLLVLTFTLFRMQPIRAQSVDQWIAQGRAALTNRDLVTAQTRFTAAVTVAPANEEANALLAATRVLALPQNPTVDAFLTRLGFSATNRSVYHWSSHPAKGTNGVLVAPVGVSAAEITGQLRQTVVPALQASLMNLNQVKSTNFVLALSAQETQSNPVTLDLGDVRLLSSGIAFLQYFALTLNSWNFDAQLTELRRLATNGTLDPGTLLAEYPHLFTFTTTNDLPAARLALRATADYYLAGSSLVRARTPGTSRLFNLSDSEADGEAQFRSSLTSLRQSFDAPTAFGSKTNLIFQLSEAFDNPPSLRELLPQFDGNGFVLGTLPDPTFGGVISGLTRATVENFLADGEITYGVKFRLNAVPHAKISAAKPTLLTFAVLPGQTYSIQTSSDLIHWTTLSQFIAQKSDAEQSLLPNGNSSDAQFLRLVEASRPANDDFGNRILLTGAPVAFVENLNGATRSATDPSALNFSPSVWFTWVAPHDGVVVLRTSGHAYPGARPFQGTTAGGLLYVGLGYGDYFQAIAGQSYQIAIGDYGEGKLELRLEYPTAPNNNTPGTAVLLSGTPLTATGQNYGASSASGASLGLTNTVWWRYVPTENGSCTVALGGAFGLNLALKVVDPATGNAIGESSFQGQVFHAVAGQPMLIAVGSTQPLSFSEFTFQLTLSLLVEEPYTFTTLAGSAGSSGSADGTGSAARFRRPSGVAVDGTGNVYVADGDNNTIRKVTVAGVVTTVAGLAQYDINGNYVFDSSGSADGTGSAARFSYPSGVAVDGTGNVYVADGDNNTIRKVTVAGVVTTVAGLAQHDINGNYVFDSSGSADGTGSAARFRRPSGVAVDGTGNVYVVDSYNHTIRKVTVAGVVTTVAGLAGRFGSADGTGSAARFQYPSGVAVDGMGNVYVAANDNHTIRKVTAAGMVTTVAGLAGTYGSANGTGSIVRFNFASGVAVDSAGNVYVVDTYNHTIRKGTH